MTSRRERTLRFQRSVKGIIMANRAGHHPDCTDTGPHFVPPSFGQIGFYSCNPPADLTNHTRCRPPFDHDHDDHGDDVFAAPEEVARRAGEHLDPDHL